MLYFLIIIKKNTRDIIILRMRTKILDDMIYSSWEIYNYGSIFAFLHFSLVNSVKTYLSWNTKKEWNAELNKKLNKQLHLHFKILLRLELSLNVLAFMI